MVHGGLAATLIDSATGCAVHTTLPGRHRLHDDRRAGPLRAPDHARHRADRVHRRGRPPRAHAGHRRGAPHRRREAARPRHRQPAHPATGRSNRVDSTTCVCVRMIPGVSRMRSSASSRCGVSRARTCRIALASPGHGVGGGDLGVVGDRRAHLGGGHPPLAEERDERVRAPAHRARVDDRRVGADDAVGLEAVDAPLDRRSAQRDAVADGLKRRARIRSKLRNDLPVDVVHTGMLRRPGATDRH